MENFNNLDIELKLLAGLPIYCDQIPIYNLKLVDIIDIGYSEYQKFLNMISLDKEAVEKLIDSKIDDDDVFIAIITILSKYNLIDLLIKFLCIIMHEDSFNITKIENNSMSIVGSKVILTKDNYKKIFEVIRKRNIAENIDEDKDNPANEIARKLLEKRKLARQKISTLKQKENQSEIITLSDLISTLANGIKMSINDVIQYDMYQFNDQFNRLKLFKDYDVNIQALLAGAKSEDLELKHWLSSNKQ